MARADRSAIRYLDSHAVAELSDAASLRLPFGLWEDTGTTIREVSKFIVALSSDYYWETDEQHRICQVSSSNEGSGSFETEALLGKTRWETGSVPVASSWNEHRARLAAREPFRNFLLRRTDPVGVTRFVSVSGMPRFGRDGDFCGYLGITRDVTTDVQLGIIGDLEIAVMQVLAGAAYADAIRATMRLICRQLAFSWGRYWELDKVRGVLCLRASTKTISSSKELKVPDDTRFTDLATEHFVTRAFRKRETVVAKVSAASDSSTAEPSKRQGIAIALRNRHTTFGVLEFRAHQIVLPEERFMRFLAHLAAQIGIAKDRERAADELRESEERFASTFELAAIGLCHVAVSGRIIHVNQRMADILGYTKDELLEKSVADISHPDDSYRSKSLIDRLMRKEIDHFELEKRYVRKHGEPVWVRIKTVMRWDEQGEPLYHVSVVEDISARKHAEEKIEHMATHDELTGLPNRALFLEFVSQAIQSVDREPEKFCAVLFVDLDRFKNINDSLGHLAGDQLLRTVSERIRGALRESDRVARFGGDEFVVLLSRIESAPDAEAVARKILAAVAEPIYLKNQECRVTGSIGIAIYPEDGADVESLIKNADVAMYSAKQSGRNDVERFSIDLTPTAINKIRLETQLQYALEKSEFRILYQPRVDALSGRVVGAEALIRWWNAELGTIPPVQFIPVAEETGLIVPIGRWLLKSACQQHLAWRRRRLRPIVVSVNLSPRQFTDPELIETIRESLDQSGMEPRFLELEITEGMLMADLERAIATATELRQLGVRLAIDDFGTGYSSLMQLKRFPLDTLKIDRSFVRDLPSNREDRAITEAIIAMGKTLGVSIVAEGIENEAQCELLQALRCDEFQGFLFGKPNHPDEIAAAIR